MGACRVDSVESPTQNSKIQDGGKMAGLDVEWSSECDVGVVVGGPPCMFKPDLCSPGPDFCISGSCENRCNKIELLLDNDVTTDIVVVGEHGVKKFDEINNCNQSDVPLANMAEIKYLLGEGRYDASQSGFPSGYVEDVNVVNMSPILAANITVDLVAPAASDVYVGNGTTLVRESRLEVNGGHAAWHGGDWLEVLRLPEPLTTNK